VDRRDEPAAKRALRYSVSERSRARPLTASCGCHHEGSGRKQASLSEILLTLLLVPQHLTATTDGQTPEPGLQRIKARMNVIGRVVRASPRSG
jgi:hypothetical protein